MAFHMLSSLHNMARVKDPVRIRMRTLVNDNKALYLDIYRYGKKDVNQIKTTIKVMKMYTYPTL